MASVTATVLCVFVAAGTSAAWARTTARAPAIDTLASGPTLAPLTVQSPVPVPAQAPVLTLATAPAPVPIPPVPLRDARTAAKAHPGDPRTLETWTHAALHAGELREARRAANAWALHDGTVEPRLAQAEILDATGRRAEARVVLQEWLEAHPDSTDARAALARISADVGTREVARR